MFAANSNCKKLLKLYNTQHVQSRLGGVMPTSNRKQVQDIGAKFQCEVATLGLDSSMRQDRT